VVKKRIFKDQIKKASDSGHLTDGQTYGVKLAPYGSNSNKPERQSQGFHQKE
jgi:hypothetical protein